MNKQTAVEWLEIQVRNFNDRKQTHYEYDQMFIQAKQMEREQIEVAFSDGQETPINHPTLPHYSREEYYNEKYSKP